ncbi:MAG: Nif3-like dinuclear metal center hexameric protein [Odoribacter sp.]|nr:Nif3-like dinuclear metal center hexameric protein [Odoribacter sp.]
MNTGRDISAVPSRAMIMEAVAAAAPLSFQESWDNSGLQVGEPDIPCSGVLLALDPTPEVIDEAIARGCNLVITHHPLLFKGLKRISGETNVERAVIKALRGGVAVYSSHTALDSAPGGLSHRMASMIGATVIAPLAPANDGAGLGVVAHLGQPINTDEFITRVKNAFGNHPFRCSRATDKMISTVALCGGSGGEFIPAAIAAGAQAYITADVRYHDFVDHGKSILITDIGHFESESCAKDIFYHVITKKFPNFAVYYSELETNPINYL